MTCMEDIRPPKVIFTVHSKTRKTEDMYVDPRRDGWDNMCDRTNHIQFNHIDGDDDNQKSQ